MPIQLEDRSTSAAPGQPAENGDLARRCQYPTAEAALRSGECYRTPPRVKGFSLEERRNEQLAMRS
jgi:hypothetical protein